MIRWLNTKEAMASYKIGKDRLKRLARNGEIKGFQDKEDHGKWLYCRYSLDAYRDNQIGQLELKAAAISKAAAR